MSKKLPKIRCSNISGKGCGVCLPPLQGNYICDELVNGFWREKYEIIPPSVCPNCGKVAQYCWVVYRAPENSTEKVLAEKVEKI